MIPLPLCRARVHHFLWASVSPLVTGGGGQNQVSRLVVSVPQGGVWAVLPVPHPPFLRCVCTSPFHSYFAGSLDPSLPGNLILLTPPIFISSSLDA